MLCAERYKHIRELGRGAYGVVHLCKPNNPQSNSTHGCDLCVVKVVQVDEQEKASVMKEAMVMRRIGECDFLVRYLDSFLHANALHIVMDFCSKGDLHNLIATKGKVPPSSVHRYSYQVAAALAFLHRNMIVHRDVKPKNIFLSDSMDAKLGDLGVCKVRMHSHDMATTFVGTALYLSPEVIQSKRYDEKCDIWSLGCVIYEMAEGRPLFNARSLAMVVNLILAGPKRPLKLSTQQTQDVLRSLSRCLQRAPAARPHARDLSVALSSKSNASVAKSYIGSSPSTHEALTPQQSNRRLHIPLAPKFTPPARSPYAVKLFKDSRYAEKPRRPRPRVAVQRGVPAFRTPAPPSPVPAPPLPTSTPCVPPPTQAGSPSSSAKPVKDAPPVVPVSVPCAPPPIPAGSPSSSAKPVQAALSGLPAPTPYAPPRIQASSPRSLAKSVKTTPPSVTTSVSCVTPPGPASSPSSSAKAVKGAPTSTPCATPSISGTPISASAKPVDVEPLARSPELLEAALITLKPIKALAPALFQSVEGEVPLSVPQGPAAKTHNLPGNKKGFTKTECSAEADVAEDNSVLEVYQPLPKDRAKPGERKKIHANAGSANGKQGSGTSTDECAEKQQEGQLDDNEQSSAEVEEKEKWPDNLKGNEETMNHLGEPMSAHLGNEETQQVELKNDKDIMDPLDKQTLAKLEDEEKQQAALNSSEQAMDQLEAEEKQQIELKDDEKTLVKLENEENHQVQLKDYEEMMDRLNDQATTELDDKEKLQESLKDDEEMINQLDEQAVAQLKDGEMQQVTLKDDEETMDQVGNEKLLQAKVENKEQHLVELENVKQQAQRRHKTVERCAEKLDPNVKNLNNVLKKKDDLKSAGAHERGDGNDNQTLQGHEKKEQRECARQERKKTQEGGGNESPTQSQNKPKQTPKNGWAQEVHELKEKLPEQQHIKSPQHDAAPLNQYNTPDRTPPAAKVDEIPASILPQRADILSNAIVAFPKADAETLATRKPVIVPAPQAGALADKPAFPSHPKPKTQGYSAAVALPKAETSTRARSGKVISLRNRGRGVSYKNSLRTSKSKLTAASNQKEPTISPGRGPLAKGPGVRLRSRRAQCSHSGCSFKPPPRGIPRSRGTPRTNVRQFFDNAVAEWKRGAGPIPAYVRKQVVEQVEKAKQEVLALPSFCAGDSSEFSLHATDLCKALKR